MSRPRPAPLSALPASFCRSLRYLFADIDDTLTADGMLPDSSYVALWDLYRAGIRVVPVTGRPAGWCDHIARMWPVAAVVGENGSFVYSYDRSARRMRRRALTGSEQHGDALRRVAERVLKEVPGTALAADQPFRISDVAIDYCEDVPPLPPERVEAICRVLAEEGVHFKVSSIHVNFWVGDFDKLTGVRAFLEEDAGAEFARAAEQAIFVGDSPNDEPLFRGFPHSVAVGNIRRFIARITHLPEYVTEADNAAGFCEAARIILGRRL